jgi:PIN domain nuclease of toxin-antitoxin system
VRVLLDSHTVLWAVDSPTMLSPTATIILQDPAIELQVSAASIWEGAIKVGSGKLKLSSPYRAWMDQALADLGAIQLSITMEYADVQAGLPKHHGDPFDRLMIAQAWVEAIAIVSIDAIFDLYGVQRLW